MGQSDQARKEAEVLYFEGVRQMQAGDLASAEDHFRQALQQFPDFAEACLNLGFLLNQRGDTTGAEHCYRRSIASDASCPQAHLNLGAILATRKKFGEAELAYYQAIMLDPAAPAPWSNLGGLYACMRREAEAEQCLRHAIALDQHYANARFNLGYLLLRQGKFEEGWACFEARNWHAALAARMPCPRWQGEALAGKAVLVGYEGGHGDMIQFSRYVELLQQRGAAAVDVLCHPPLKALFGSLRGVDRVIGYDEALPQAQWDCWVPLLSMPYLCGTTLDSIPAPIPYLHALPERLEKWLPLLPHGGLRVGLVWKGSPQFENDADRSLQSLQQLLPLAGVAGVQYVSLQRGAGEEEARHPPPGFHLLDLGARMDDFADAAAIIAGLDLVICVDTAIAHLAGALGKPCWVMLPYYKPDWRWLEERSDTPWYPGMRLFRQAAMGAWEEVVAQIAGELARLVQGNTQLA